MALPGGRRRGQSVGPGGPRHAARAPGRARRRRRVRHLRRPARPRSSAEQPDVVLTDIRMPPTGTDEGIRAALALRDSHPDIGVVVLSPVRRSRRTRSRSWNAAPQGRAYLLKERVSTPAQIVHAIEEVAAGGSVIDPMVVEALVAQRTAERRLPSSASRRAKREVLEQMAQGRNNAGYRPGALPVGTCGREAHQLVVLEARPLRGTRRAPPGEGGLALPLRTGRLSTPERGRVHPGRAGIWCNHGPDESVRRSGTTERSRRSHADLGRPRPCRC